ncbi:COG1361 S-layer family protein [Halococcoides cellulosivorans]|uniref:Sialidase n=1 Tax=Halococcoides cellulosivorans TaxID=1679096 RepID=A0A2R4WXK4_9EURY|nr:hypothetical protein [Halococcoides cellulosivorans]AWB26274.1 hypothetical protein HARCEL1_00340 [Halococcoides cellulosivorans]
MGAPDRPVSSQQIVALAVVLVVTSAMSTGPLGVGTAEGASATTIEGTPHLNASAPDARLDPGATGTVTVTLTNDATYDDNGTTHPPEARERAGEARSVSVALDDESAPLTVETGNRSAGTIADGETATQAFDVVVDEDAPAGTYDLTVETEYRHAERVTYESVADGEYAYNESVVTRTETDTVTVEIEPQAQFAVTNLTHDVPLGGEGTVALSVTNVGSANVSEATVSLASGDADLSVGSGGASSSANVGSWAANETKTLTYRASTADSAVQREYPLDATVEYTDGDGARQSDGEQIGLEPIDRTEFPVVALDHDVPRGGEGTLTVSLTNGAPTTITEVGVTASAPDSTVTIGDSPQGTTAVAAWAPNETREFTFRVQTDGGAVERPYPVELGIEYTDRDDNANSVTEVLAFTPADPERFAIDLADHDVPEAGAGTATLSLENQRSTGVSDVSVRVTADDGAVSVGGDGSTAASSALGSLTGGERESVPVRVATSADAIDRDYPLTVEVRYTDADNDVNTQTETLQFGPGDREQFAIESIDHDVPRDGIGTVTVVAENTAGEDLDDVTVTLSTAESAFFVGAEGSRSGAASAAEWEESATRRFTYRVGTSGAAVDREYPFDISFEYTDAENSAGTYTADAAIRPQSDPRFVVESVDHDVAIGSTGRVQLTLRNDGPVDASEAILTASAESDAMFVGTGGSEPVEVQGVSLDPPEQGSPTAQAYVGDWPVGENRTVTLRAGFGESAIVRNYVTSLSIDYENARGDAMPQRTRSVGIRPLPAQQFAYDRVESDLHVGEEGTLVANVTNRANRTVDGLVVTAASQDQNVNFYNARSTVGELAAGESATVRYRVGITAEAERGTRVFELSARYRGSRDDRHETDARDLLVDVGAERDAFDVAVANGSFAPGESGPFAVTITNRRNETLSNVQAKLFTDDPLGSGDDSAFVTELAPGESATLRLDLSVASGASAKTYAASMDFRFDDSRGDSELSDTYRVPVRVERESSGGLPLWLVPMGLLGGASVVGWHMGRDRLTSLVDRPPTGAESADTSASAGTAESTDAPESAETPDDTE